jgi:hypothetical protein
MFTCRSNNNVNNIFLLPCVIVISIGTLDTQDRSSYAPTVKKEFLISWTA